MNTNDAQPDTTTDASIGDGGPAFPMIRDMRNSPDWDHEPGMTLLDYFAAKAMQEQIRACDGLYLAGSELAVKQNGEIAASAYAMAEAMLRARAKLAANGATHQ